MMLLTAARRRFAILSLLGAPLLPLHAQIASSPRYGLSYSAGWHAPVNNHSRITDDRNLTVIGVERRFAIRDGRLGSFSFVPSLLPVVSAGHNRRVALVPCPSSATLIACTDNVPYLAFGPGLLPLGLRVETPTTRRVGLMTTVDAGGVWFNDRVPSPHGTRFNFVARGSLGAAFRVQRRA
jgi:hypothetical protein